MAPPESPSAEPEISTTRVGECRWRRSLAARRTPITESKRLRITRVPEGRKRGGGAANAASIASRAQHRVEVGVDPYLLLVGIVSRRSHSDRAFKSGRRTAHMTTSVEPADVELHSDSANAACSGHSRDRDPRRCHQSSSLRRKTSN